MCQSSAKLVLGLEFDGFFDTSALSLNIIVPFSATTE
jgi:hypothetical protein